MTIEKEWLLAQKRPVVIEFREPVPNVTAYFNSVTNKVFDYMGTTPVQAPTIEVEKIETLEGTHYAIPGKDFVIRGIKGELYPIKKDIFYESYMVLAMKKGTK
jgi:hypothetical protein